MMQADKLLVLYFLVWFYKPNAKTTKVMRIHISILISFLRVLVKLFKCKEELQ